MRADAGGIDENGVPTSYYAAAQLSCRAVIVDDPQEKANLLNRQLGHFQPAGDHPAVAVGEPPYGPMLAEIRGLRLTIKAVAAKFKFDDQSPPRLRISVADRLDVRRLGRDGGAAAQQRRSLQRIGAWTAG